MQHILVSAYGMKWQKRRYGGIYSENYKAAKEREAFTMQQWQNFQQEQLTKILLHAYGQVPYYKSAFEQTGLDFSSIKNISPETINSLPVLTKEDLRKHGTTTLLAQNREANGEFFASSGSTGTPTQILFSHAMHQRWTALFESRVRNWAGVDRNTPRGMIGGRRVLPAAAGRPPFHRYNIFEKQVYFSAYHINAANAAHYAKAIKDYGVEYMTGYAMSNYLLACFLYELKIKLPKLKCVITSSEKLTDEMRSMFTKVYGCKTYDGWSGVEACGLITECEYGSLHISPDAGFTELLDDNMQPVQPGEAGNVYCTGFLNYDQPLIRYDIGDTMILGENNCACGRQMPVIKEIIGRQEDVVTGKDGRKMVRFHGIFNGLHSVKQAQVIQESFDEIVIKIVAAYKDDNEKEIMIKRVQSQLGDIRVQVEEVENIPQTANGKFKAVISKVRTGDTE